MLIQSKNRREDLNSIYIWSLKNTLLHFFFLFSVDDWCSLVAGNSKRLCCVLKKKKKRKNARHAAAVLKLHLSAKDTVPKAV